MQFAAIDKNMVPQYMIRLCNWIQCGYCRSKGDEDNNRTVSKARDSLYYSTRFRAGSGSGQKTHSAVTESALTPGTPGFITIVKYQICCFFII